MEQRATPYTYSDWMLLAVAGQSLIDLFTPNGTFGRTGALACLLAAFRFVIYAVERIFPIAKSWGGHWVAVAVMTIIICAAIWFVPDGVIYLTKLSGR
jgi:hypothetical protein